jgi:NAD(P)-dependent dehydrogenase (short-subunit alcohol dehydrogenase family)
MNVRDKVAIVTGAGGTGQGRALARLLAREGARVVVSDIDERGGNETVAMIVASGGAGYFVPANVEREDDFIRLIRHAEDRFGGLDIMVNNAGPYHPGDPLKFWIETLQSNLMGSIYGTLRVIEPMRRRGGGVILYYGSTSALGYGRKHSSSPAYDVAKAALARLATTTAWMRDLYNIRTNCIVPDWVATDEVKAYWETLRPEERRAQGVPAELTSLEEISAAAFRLITDESLFGRVLVWWSGEKAGLIPVGDTGYCSLEVFTDGAAV